MNNNAIKAIYYTIRKQCPVCSRNLVKVKGGQNFFCAKCNSTISRERSMDYREYINDGNRMIMINRLREFARVMKRERVRLGLEEESDDNKKHTSTNRQSASSNN